MSDNRSIILNAEGEKQRRAQDEDISWHKMLLQLNIQGSPKGNQEIGKKNQYWKHTNLNIEATNSNLVLMIPSLHI